MLHHPSVYTTTENVVHGTGVKSRVFHTRGAFIGFYSGKLLQPCASHPGKDRRFEVAGTNGHMIMANSQDDVMGFVNEPPLGCVSNLVAIPLHLDLGNAVGYFVCVDELPAHTEMWVHYGDTFERDYVVGEPGDDPDDIQRADAVVPQRTMLSERYRFMAPRCSGYRGAPVRRLTRGARRDYPNRCD